MCSVSLTVIKVSVLPEHPGGVPPQVLSGFGRLHCPSWQPVPRSQTVRRSVHESDFRNTTAIQLLRACQAKSFACGIPPPPSRQLNQPQNAVGLPQQLIVGGEVATRSNNWFGCCHHGESHLETRVGGRTCMARHSIIFYKLPKNISNRPVRNKMTSMW